MTIPIIGEKKHHHPVFTPRELGTIELALQGLIKNFELGSSTGDREVDELIGQSAESAHTKVFEALTILNGANDGAK